MLIEVFLDSEAAAGALREQDLNTIRSEEVLYKQKHGSVPVDILLAYQRNYRGAAPPRARRTPRPAALHRSAFAVVGDPAALAAAVEGVDVDAEPLAVDAGDVAADPVGQDADAVGEKLFQVERGLIGGGGFDGAARGGDGTTSATPCPSSSARRM